MSGPVVGYLVTVQMLNAAPALLEFKEEAKARAIMGALIDAANVAARRPKAMQREPLWVRGDGFTLDAAVIAGVTLMAMMEDPLRKRLLDELREDDWWKEGGPPPWSR